MTTKASKIQRLEHKFVESFPDIIENGFLYVSIPFSTVCHKCCCGCGTDVITPISPHEWQITFDGESISLNPSIGNWGLECQSHYWITHGQVKWARKWTSDEIADGRNRDEAHSEEFYHQRRTNKTDAAAKVKDEKSGKTLDIWKRIKTKLKK